MRIITFNAYWLQGSGYKHTDPGPPRADVLSAVAELLMDTGGDLLCVQEVQSFEAARALARAVSLPWWYYRPGRLADRPQYGGGLLARDPRWAFAPVDCDPIERFAIKAVRDGDGLCVANVHLRSDRFADQEQSAAARRAELATVINTAPRPHIVVGDFNAVGDARLWQVLADKGYLDALAAAGHADDPRLGRTQSDAIWIDDQLAGRLEVAFILPRAQFALTDAEFISDHLPVIADLEL